MPQGIKLHPRMSSSQDNKIIINNSSLKLGQDAECTMLFMKIHMGEVVDVAEGGGEAGDRVGAGVAMEHIKIMVGTQTGEEEVDEAEAGDIMMVGIKVDVVGAEAMHGHPVVVGEWEGVLEVVQTRSRRHLVFAALM